MQIVGIPAFRDNYIWLLRQGRAAVVVDPGDDEPVADYLARNELTLQAILVTHHHPDHMGGVAALNPRHDLPVYGPAGETILVVNRPLNEGESVDLPQIGVSFATLDVPGHTRGHVAYYGANVLFCGDTLFACGCGRLFEGTPEQMWNSLRKIADLPAETMVYCAHEYTEANIAFARSVEPHNEDLKAREAKVRELRAAGKPSVPFQLGEELATNPFLRVSAPSVREAALHYSGEPLEDEVSVFRVIREWKNRF